MKDHPEATDPQSDNPGTRNCARTLCHPAVRGDGPVHIPYRRLHHGRCHHHDFPSSDSSHRLPVGYHPVHHLQHGEHSRDGSGIRHRSGPCNEDRQVRLPPPASTAIQVQGTTTSKVTLRRGKGDGAAPWPVRATGPAPVPSNRSCQKPSGPTAHRRPILLPQFSSLCRQSGPCRRRCPAVL